MKDILKKDLSVLDINNSVKDRLKENEIGKNKVKIALREYAGKGKYIEELV